MKRLVILFVIISISSCCPNKGIYNDGVQIVNKEESFVLDMCMLIEFYTKIYTKSPTSADELIVFIEGMDDDTRLVYLRQYKYLKKKRNMLVFITETEILDSEIMITTSVYLNKAIPRKGVCKAFVYFPKQTIE